MSKRGQIGWQELLPWLIGIGVAVLVLASYFVLSGKGTNALQYLKNIFRFGR